MLFMGTAAAYGRGGTRPTITDAFVALGFIGHADLGYNAVTIDTGNGSREAIPRVATGTYPMGAPMTVLQLIAVAGGLTPFAPPTSRPVAGSPHRAAPCRPCRHCRAGGRAGSGVSAAPIQSSDWRWYWSLRR